MLDRCPLWISCAATAMHGVSHRDREAQVDRRGTSLLGAGGVALGVPAPRITCPRGVDERPAGVRAVDRRVGLDRVTDRIAAPSARRVDQPGCLDSGAWTMPAVAVRVESSGFPIATTGSPTATMLSESPMRDVDVSDGRECASTWSTAIAGGRVDPDDRVRSSGRRPRSRPRLRRARRAITSARSRVS